jgi:hypothetical protein
MLSALVGILSVCVVFVLVAFGPPLLFERRVITIDEPMATLTAAMCMAMSGVVTMCWAAPLILAKRDGWGAVIVAVVALLCAAGLVNRHAGGMIWLP